MDKSSLIIVIILIFILTSLVSAQPVEYYKEFRGQNYSEFFMDAWIDEPGLAELLNYMVLHDSGNLNIHSSYESEEFLRDRVLNKIKTEGVELQNGEILRYENPSRLELAKLIYYYVRDEIYYPQADERTGIDRKISSIPFIGLAYLMHPEVIKFPSEVFITEHGTCFDQSTLLAALYKIEGYDVAIGFFTPFSVEVGGKNAYFSYHTCVFLKDEGWGVGRCKLDGLDGDWILLDPINSPRHAPHMQMIGGGRVLEFGDYPNWVRYVKTEFIQKNPFGYRLVSAT